MGPVEQYSCCNLSTGLLFPLSAKGCDNQIRIPRSGLGLSHDYGLTPRCLIVHNIQDLRLELAKSRIVASPYSRPVRCILQIIKWVHLGRKAPFSLRFIQRRQPWHSRSRTHEHDLRDQLQGRLQHEGVCPKNGSQLEHPFGLHSCGESEDQLDQRHR